MNRDEMTAELLRAHARAADAMPPYNASDLSSEVRGLYDAFNRLHSVVCALVDGAEPEPEPEPPAIVDEYTYATVYEAGNWSYDWNVTAVFKRSDGAMAVVQGSGCSCDSWEPDNMAPTGEYMHDVSEIHRRFRNALGDNTYVWNAAKAFEHMDAMQLAVREAQQSERNR